jgi:hypothetical protein
MEEKLMKKVLIGLMSGLLIGTMASAAFAKNGWQQMDEQRIQQGVRNGTINPNEEKELMSHLERINNYAEQAHQSGGKIGFMERMKLQSMKAGMRIAIFKDKHDVH